jgi:hypothetical protein
VKDLNSPWELPTREWQRIEIKAYRNCSARVELLDPLVLG